MTVAAVADGVLANLSARIPDVAKVELIDRNGPRALEMVRHDLAHVFAEAVWTLWPGTRTAIGPRLDMAFFCDFARDAPFTPEDLPAIERMTREIIAARTPFTCEVWTRDQAKDRRLDYGVGLVFSRPSKRRMRQTMACHRTKPARSNTRT